MAVQPALIDESEITEIKDPKLKAIAERILNESRVATEKAIAHEQDPRNFPLSADQSSNERTILSRFRQLDARKKQTATSKVMASVRLSPAERTNKYGDLARVNLSSEVPVEQQMKASRLPERLTYSGNDFSNNLGLASSLRLINKNIASKFAGLNLRDLIPLVTTPSPPQEWPKLEFRLYKIKCVDETDGIGSDDISFASILVDGSGDQAKWGPSEEWEFDDGVERTFPPLVLRTFNLKETINIPVTGPVGFWPKYYQALLCLAEKDNGGFASFLLELWNKVKGKVLEAVGAAVGGFIGAAAGSVVPGLGTAIGAAIGAAVGWILGNLIEWLISLWEDDMFPPTIAKVKITGLNGIAGDTGTHESSMKMRWVAAHGVNTKCITPGDFFSNALAKVSFN
jgi:hypothetical protein